MLAGNSFYLVHRFKVAESNHGHSVMSLSFSFLTCHVNMFAWLKEKPTVNKNFGNSSKLLLTFLPLHQSRLAKICMNATLILLEIRQVSYKTRRQEQPCFFSWLVLACFGLHGKSFLSLHLPFALQDKV